MNDFGTGGFLLTPTVDDDFESLNELKKFNRDAVIVIEVVEGIFENDFSEATGYKVDILVLATLTEENLHEAIRFSYPAPNEPEVPQEFRKPLSVEFEELKQENRLLKAQNNALSERADFIGDVVAEMATQVYH